MLLNKKVTGILLFILSLFLYFFILNNLYNDILSNTDNTFTYPLDDSYIHMAIAKNIINHGIWGINSLEFGSASSSPLYTILLTIIFFLFGINQYYPIILNIIISILILFATISFFKNKINSFFLLLLLIGIIILTPLPSMTLLGMEHLIHAFLTLLYTLTLWKIIIDKETSKKTYFFYYIICFLLTISRYEGLFLIMGGSLILLYLKKYKLCFIGGGLGCLSVSIFGLYFISQGGTFFPYSIIIKTSLTSQSFFDKLFPLESIQITYIKDKFNRNLLFNFGLVLLFSLIVQVIVRKENIKKIMGIILAFIINLILYVLYSKFGWLHRYEAFIFPALLSIGVYSIYELYCQIKHSKKYIPYSLLLILLIYPTSYFTKRSLYNFHKIPFASKDIYSQQYQTAKFIKKYYNNSNVGINDIGYPSFLSNSNIIDLYGLGNSQIALAKKNNPENITPIINKELTKNNVPIIIIYKSWFDKDLYKGLVNVGSWKLTYRKSITFSDQVYIFSTRHDKESLDYLKKSLHEFNKNDLAKSSKFIWSLPDSIQ